jgi:hypothetical protein
MYGEWRTTPRDYARDVALASERVGPPDFVSIQDWMCEPHMLRRTGKTVAQHQDLSVRSYLELASIDPSIPWMPVVQGWSLSDYVACVSKYYKAGVDLAQFPVVGVGSVCRRQGPDGVAVVRAMSGLGLRVHAFGFKKTGLPSVCDVIASSDSMAWSLAGRHDPDPTHRHASCANCFEYAMRWRDSVIDACATPRRRVSARTRCS